MNYYDTKNYDLLRKATFAIICSNVVSKSSSSLEALYDDDESDESFLFIVFKKITES